MIDWNKQFCLATLNRADLTELHLSDEQILLFTDEVMAEIVHEMEGFYFLNAPFWEDLKKAITLVMKRRNLHMTPFADTDKEFPIASLTRADLKEAGFSDTLIAQLSDDDMATIASKLEDTYRENQLFIDVEIEVTLLLEEQETTDA